MFHCRSSSSSHDMTDQGADPTTDGLMYHVLQGLKAKVDSLRKEGKLFVVDHKLLAVRVHTMHTS